MGFRENLKTQLKDMDILVKELAAKSGIKKSRLDSYLRENGYSPSAEAAVKIAKALGVSVEYLVTGQEGLGQTQGKGFYAPELDQLIQSFGELGAQNRKIAVKIAIQVTKVLNDALKNDRSNN
jgi:transcriptional regulator with XRE-family HTH domain